MTLGFGIIGATEANEEMVIAGLADLRDAAAADGADFWAVVGVTAQSPVDAVTAAFNWLLENGVPYDIIVEPALFEAIAEDTRTGAEKTIKVKDVDSKVVDRVLEFEGTHMLVLVGAEEPEQSVQEAAQRAFDSGLKVLDLADSLAEIDFGPDTQDAAEMTEETKPDFELLGADADGGDADSITTLTDMTEEAGLDINDWADNSWTELAEKLNELYDEANTPPPAPAKKAAPAKAAAPAKKAAAKPTAAATTEPLAWTEENLPTVLKELRTIGAQSGIEGAAKMAAPALRAALIAMSGGERQDAVHATAKAATIGKTVDYGDVELNGIISELQTAIVRLGHYLAAK